MPYSFDCGSSARVFAHTLHIKLETLICNFPIIAPMNHPQTIFDVGALPSELQLRVFEEVLLSEDPIDERTHARSYQNILSVSMSEARGAKNTPLFIHKLCKQYKRSHINPILMTADYENNIFRMEYGYGRYREKFHPRSWHGTYENGGNYSCQVRHLIVDLCVRLYDMFGGASRLPTYKLLPMEPKLLLTPRSSSSLTVRNSYWLKGLTQLNTFQVNMDIEVCFPRSRCHHAGPYGCDAVFQHLGEQLSDYFTSLPSYSIRVRAEAKIKVKMEECITCSEFHILEPDRGDSYECAALLEEALLELFDGDTNREIEG